MTFPHLCHDSFISYIPIYIDIDSLTMKLNTLWNVYLTSETWLIHILYSHIDKHRQSYDEVEHFVKSLFYICSILHLRHDSFIFYISIQTDIDSLTMKLNTFWRNQVSSSVTKLFLTISCTWWLYGAHICLHIYRVCVKYIWNHPYIYFTHTRIVCVWNIYEMYCVCMSHTHICTIAHTGHISIYMCIVWNIYEIIHIYIPHTHATCVLCVCEMYMMCVFHTHTIQSHTYVQSHTRYNHTHMYNRVCISHTHDTITHICTIAHTGHISIYMCIVWNI